MRTAKNTRRQLAVEPLETRDTPALFGLGWQDRNVTVSAVPDGTAVDGAPSNLFATLGAGGVSAAQAQGEVARALRAWAGAANLNFGWVGDDGSAVGAAGAAQGDARFGDIRISARPLDNVVLATTTPSGLYAGTRAGDIVLNSNLTFSLGGGAGTYDLYTVLLQETGHALGLGNATAAGSVMFETYGGARAGLAAADATALSALYGARVDPAGTGDNNSQAKAFALPAVSGTSTKYVRGDIESATDTDFFKFTTPASVPAGVTVTLRTAGYSGLGSQVALLNAAGAVLASSVGAAGEDVVLALPSAAGNTTYAVRIQGAAGSPFALGGYKLSVATDPAAADPALAADAVAYTADAGTNETPGAATRPTIAAAPGTLGAYEAHAVVGAADLDFYRFTVPATYDHGNVFSVTVRDADNGQTPVVRLYNSSGTQLWWDNVTPDDAAGKTYQVTGLDKGEQVYVRVSASADAPAGGRYDLNAEFRAAAKAMTYQVLDTNTLTAAAPQAFRSLYVLKAQAMSFNIGALVSGGAAPVMTVSIYNWAGQLVTAWTTLAGWSAGKTVELLPGEYAIRVSAPVTGAVSIQYQLRMFTQSDPIGIDPLDPNYRDPFSPPPLNPTLPPPPPPPVVTPPPPPPAGSPPDFGFYVRPPSYFMWLMPLL